MPTVECVMVMHFWLVTAFQSRMSMNLSPDWMALTKASCGTEPQNAVEHKLA